MTQDATQLEILERIARLLERKDTQPPAQCDILVRVADTLDQIAAIMDQIQQELAKGKK